MENVIKCKESGKNHSGHKNLRVRFIQCNSINSKLEITKFGEETVDAIHGICNKNEGWIIDVLSQEKRAMSLLKAPHFKHEEEGTSIIVDGRHVLMELNINLYPIVNMTL